MEAGPAICVHSRSAVEAKGYDLETADNGSDGIALITRTLYDAIVIDCQLPDMTGIDVARRLLGHDSGLAITSVTESDNEALIAVIERKLKRC